MATYYICDVQSGTTLSAGMVGSDSRTSTQAQNSATPWRTWTGLVNNLGANNLQAGDQVLFACGGCWTGWSVTGIVIPINSATNPLVFGTYVTSEGDTNAPWLKSNSGQVAWSMGSFGNTAVEGGFTWDGLKMDGQGVALWCFFADKYTQYVTIQNCEITGFDIGIHSQSTAALPNYQWKVRNNNFHHIYGVGGILGCFTSALVEGNTFAQCGGTGGFDHGNYFGGDGDRLTVRNNTYYNNGNGGGASTTCDGGNITIHGTWDQCLIEGNLIYADAFTGNAYALSLNPGYSTAEYNRRFVVRGNRMANLFWGVSATACPNILIENNVFANTIGGQSIGIAIPERPYSQNGGADDHDTGAIIRHNSIYMANPGAGSIGIRMSNVGSGGNLATLGSDAVVANNLIVFGTTTNSPAGFAESAFANYAFFDYNVVRGASRWSATYANLAAAQAAGFDTNGSSGDPFMTVPSAANSWSVAITSDSSVCHNAGNNTWKAKFDNLGAVRDTTPTIGATERSPLVAGTLTPRSPQRFR